MKDFALSASDMLVLVLLVALLFGLFRALRLAATRVGLARRHRAVLLRVLPIAEALTYIVFALVALPLVLDEHPQVTTVAIGLLLTLLVAVSWFALRDFVAGVFVKGGQVCTRGDYVRFGEVEGRVVRLALRTLTIETGAGDEAIIPYSQLLRGSLVRTPIPDGAFRHAFTVAPPDGMARSDAEATIRRLALCCHWASMVREPQVELAGDGALRVTVFALVQHRGPDIEAEVRRLLA